MVDCITICNSACITCIWCFLFSVWYELVTARREGRKDPRDLCYDQDWIRHTLRNSSRKSVATLNQLTVLTRKNNIITESLQQGSTVTLAKHIMITALQFMRYFPILVLSFPRFSKNLKTVDSSECCVRGKPTRKPRKLFPPDFSRRMKIDSVHARRRFKDHSRVCHLDCENRRENGLRSGEKVCDRVSGERRRYSGKTGVTSSMLNRRVKQTDVGSRESDSSLSGKNHDTTLNEEDRTRARS